MRLRALASSVSLSLALLSSGCKVDDGSTTSAPLSDAGASGDPGSSSTSGGPASADGGTGGDGGGGACSAAKCGAGLGCGPLGECAACTKDCGPNGTCVVGWESGQHCKCAAGYYETANGCAPAAGTPCAGVTCSGHGTCYAGPAVIVTAECHCEGDYVSWGQACAARGAIRCIDADGTLKDKGTIRCNAAGTAFEVCRDGDGDGRVEWVASGTPTCGKSCQECLDTKCDSGDGTGGQKCPTGTQCMSTVHEMPVYRCMASCDCTNCGTCDPGQFTGYQRSCGGTTNDFSSATKVCASPCPHAGDGCLPYGQFAYCFPSEGCASAAPQ